MGGPPLWPPLDKPRWDWLLILNYLSQTLEAVHRHAPAGKTTYSVHISWCKKVTSSEWERVRVVHQWQLAIPQPHQAKHQGEGADTAAIGASWVGTSTWLVAGQTLLSLWGCWQRTLSPQMSIWLLMTAYNTVQWRLFFFLLSARPIWTFSHSCSYVKPRVVIDESCPQTQQLKHWRHFRHQRRFTPQL